MLELVKWVKNECPKTGCEAQMQLMSAEEVKKARAFHKSFPQYAETPLVNLSGLAQKLGVKGIYLKDESKRFNLNAFKVLGGSYAMARYIAELVGCDISELPYDRLVSREIRDQIGEVTFYTATDGNHGRGVAWAANKLNQKSVVYMPYGSSQTRLKNIQREGARASITDLNYDDAVRMANAEAEKTPNSVMVQDTAWEGYEKIPGWIMQGYGTLALEADEQIKAQGEIPTHIFAQAGVGSFAGAVQGYFANAYGKDCPVTTVIESNVADCLYKSAIAKEYSVTGGRMQTIMAGLACGEPNTISWEILKNKTDFFVSAPDWVSAKGMRTAASPVKGDPAVISGESGAVGLGLVSAMLQGYNMDGLKDALGLNEDSVILLFSTEGDTDPQKYEDIVWNGEIPSVKDVAEI